MKVNFKIEIKKLDGTVLTKKELGDCESNEMIGLMLISPGFKDGDLLRNRDLADRIYRDGEIDITKSDLELVKEAVKNEQNGYTPLVNSSILKVLEDIKFITEPKKP